MQTRDQVKEVITALVSSGWLLPRHVIEAMQKLEEMEKEKPAIVRAWERLETARDDNERIEAFMAFNKVYDKLLPDAKAQWGERKKTLVQAWLSKEIGPQT